MTAKMYALFVGWLFLIIAVAAVVTGTVNEGLLLGLFNVTPVTQTLIHFVTGGLALFVAYASKEYYAVKYAQVFGLVYVLVALWGLPALAGGLDASSPVLFGLINVNLPTELLHIVVGALGLYVGFGNKSAGEKARA